MFVDKDRISVFIHPASTSGIAYKLDLMSEGDIVATIGESGLNDSVDDPMFFVPKMAKYARLSESEHERMLNLISKISTDEQKVRYLLMDGILL